MQQDLDLLQGNNLDLSSVENLHAEKPKFLLVSVGVKGAWPFSAEFGVSARKEADGQACVTQSRRGTPPFCEGIALARGGGEREIRRCLSALAVKSLVILNVLF